MDRDRLAGLLAGHQAGVPARAALEAGVPFEVDEGTTRPGTS